MKRYRVKNFELGLVYVDGELTRVLKPGKHWIFSLKWNTKVVIRDRRIVTFLHSELEEVLKTGLMDEYLEVVDLQDDQRAMVFVNGRFKMLVGPGLHAFQKGYHKVKVEVHSVKDGRFQHSNQALILKHDHVRKEFYVFSIVKHHIGMLYKNGEVSEILPAGAHVFWQGHDEYSIKEIDMRDDYLEINGQELMTLDKVTLRLNALVTYRVVDPRKAMERSSSIIQSLYREAQLVIRALVGGYGLDDLLISKHELSISLQEKLTLYAEQAGLKILAIGIKDIILTGDMKDLMNRVTEAKKAAEANLISRREETAAIRTQVNAAKLLADHPVLMRIRELEVLEKIAQSGNMNVVLGEKGLADRVVNLI